jgi:hypothetical protein
MNNSKDLYNFLYFHNNISLLEYCILIIYGLQVCKLKMLDDIFFLTLRKRLTTKQKISQFSQGLLASKEYI